MKIPNRAVAAVLLLSLAACADAPPPPRPKQERPDRMPAAIAQQQPLELGERCRNCFYLPENPEYTIVDSVRDSIRFTVTKTLDRCSKGHYVSTSSFVDPEGNVMGWHDFGNLEGPGWAANAAGGALEIYTMGRFLGDKDLQEKGLGIVDHVLDHGFIGERTGIIMGYRDIKEDKIVLNYTHGDKWFCPGSMCKIAFQLLTFADEIKGDPRAEKMRAAAKRCVEWIDKNLGEVENGWFPRRCEPNGAVYKKSATGGNDPFWQTSGDGLFILQLQAALTQRGMADYKKKLAERIKVFMEAGGFFASINHDTYDPNENVAYSVAFRTLLLSSRVLDDAAIRAFAYEKCLKALDEYKMRDDRAGVKTRGLLYMEKSWPTSYMWENAEAALAFFEAAKDTRESDPAASREYELDGLTILRAVARHHYGPHGFLTEGLDWSNHVGEKHHVNNIRYGAIKYTEPFLNNQHITEPTLFYLQNLAKKTPQGNGAKYVDMEGNVILTLPLK